MPTNIRVVSWNYDMQFEKSFAEFIPDVNPGENGTLPRCYRLYLQELSPMNTMLVSFRYSNSTERQVPETIMKC